jgi:hypothetical protein
MAARVAQALSMSEAVLGKWRPCPSRPPSRQRSAGAGKQAVTGPVGPRGDGARYFKKSADHLFATDGPVKRFAFIALHVPCWPVRQQCRLLGVSPSGYYAWQKRVPVAVAEPALAAWQVAAQRIFTTHAGRYGQRRLCAQLRREGHSVGRQRLRGWPSASGLRALCTRANSQPPRTTQADPRAIAANKLATWPAGQLG